MNEVIASAWEDYALIDSGHGQRLERFGAYTVVRPDPNVLWSPSQPDHAGWRQPDAYYHSREEGWSLTPGMPERWPIKAGDAAFSIGPTPFRHMGIFPEQSAHWNWLREVIAANQGDQPIRVLNLFGYTGGASIVAAKAGASVCHVDAAQGSVNWAKENAHLSGLSETAIRWIVDDALKFVRREVKRGSQYEIILMDPPVFGRGPKGEIWRLEERLPELLELTSQLYSQRPLGVLMNFYATALYPESILRLGREYLGKQFPSMAAGSLLLAEESGNQLPTGYFLRS